jgi:hypothetical protein
VDVCITGGELGSNLIKDIVGNLARGAVECWVVAVVAAVTGVRGLVSRSNDGVASVNFVSGCVTNVGRDGGLGMIGFPPGVADAGLVSTVEPESMLTVPEGKNTRNFRLGLRTILFTLNNFIFKTTSASLWPK